MRWACGHGHPLPVADDPEQKEVTAMPRGTWSPKRERQYKHIKESELEQGRSEDRAEEIAARTVNRQRQEAGETKAARSRKGTGR